jgi:hypothetical protein
VPAGVPTYQYASVSVNYVLPNVPYVKLADLYLPNEQEPNSLIIIKGSENSSYIVTVASLVNESECGSGEEGGGGPPGGGGPIEEEVVDEDDCYYGGGGPSTGTGAPAGEWRPSGRMTMNDDVLGTIGVEGIKVRARRWFTTYTGITDANGYYHVDGTYTRPANYWLDFERYDFSVNDHSGGPKEISGPKVEVPWNVDFTGYDKFCATIFRAAHHYYYRDIQGLRRPPQNSFWNTQMKLGAFNESGGDLGDHSSWRRMFGLGEQIHIYGPNRSSMEIYSTAIHELAHAVHWDLSAVDYERCDNIVGESWPRGVEWVLTKMIYPAYRGRENSAVYTNVVMDMIDSSGQEHYNYGTFAPIDQVNGYSIIQIQNALVDSPTFDWWEFHIYFSDNNPTKSHLNDLFNYWKNP